MRTKDEGLLIRIENYVNDYCEENGQGPSLKDIAVHTRTSKTGAFNYLSKLVEENRIAREGQSYVSNKLTTVERDTVPVAILGAVPCGPLTNVEECVEGYIRLPSYIAGKGKFYLLRASGTSMINAGICDGDLVLIKQQQNAEIGQIIVALVENEVTLKRLGYDKEERKYYLHPENKRMRDIYIDSLEVQGVAVKVIKDVL